MKNFYSKTILSIFALLVFSTMGLAQTTAFNYQGRLNDGGNAANGNYDMQFRLFDMQGAGQGTQQGATVSVSPVAVSSGNFKVELDFGATVFATGADRFLEISIRPAGSTGGYTSLAPRQKLTSAPFSVRTLSAATADDALNLGGVAASEYVTTTNGGTNFIQNTTSPQAASNFNISGNGRIGGFLDIAFWRPSNGNWFVLRSEDSSFFAFPWGTTGDVPTPGDYDGDGKFDAAVFRPSNATWFVQRSTAGILIQQFGLSSDTPVPSAYVP